MSKNSNKLQYEKSKSGIVFDVFNGIFLILLSFCFLFPFWRIIMISLNEGMDSLRGGINFWFRKFTLDNYKLILSRPELSKAYGITLFRTIIGAPLSVFLMATMAYPLSKSYIKGRKFINGFLLVTMFFSGGLIPTFLLYKDINLINSVWVYILPTLYNAYNIFIIRTFFRAMPADLEEAASLDGANDAVIFFRLVLPMSKPILATMLLFSAIGHWNDYMTAIMYTSNRNLQPLQTFLYRLLNEQQLANKLSASGQLVLSSSASTVTPLAIQMAALVVVVVPIMLIYPFLQKHFVKGVMIGSLKG